MFPRLPRYNGPPRRSARYKYAVRTEEKQIDRKKRMKRKEKERRGEIGTRRAESGESREYSRGRNQSLEKAATQLARRVYRVPGANADDSSFLLGVGYFRLATIFEGDSSRGFAAVLVRVRARWPAQHRPHRRPRRRRETRRQGSRFAGSSDTRAQTVPSCTAASETRSVVGLSSIGGRSLRRDRFNLQSIEDLAICWRFERPEKRYPSERIYSLLRSKV